jgi:predicted AAA+ superfamily ATPase
MTAQSGRTPSQARQDGDYWGHLVESCVGAHLRNSAAGTGIEVSYWRERNHEVDFILNLGPTTVAIEVKNDRRRDTLAGMEAFGRALKPQRKLIVGSQGIPLEEFLSQPANYWMQ